MRTLAKIIGGVVVVGAGVVALHALAYQWMIKVSPHDHTTPTS